MIVNDVGWTTLVRDVRTANAYLGQRVRFELPQADYEIREGELRIWIMQKSHPPVIFCRGDVLAASGKIIVVGVVREVVRDGKWRSPRTDFHVIIDECVITARWGSP